MPRSLRELVAQPAAAVARGRWLSGYLRGAIVFRKAHTGLRVNVQGPVRVDARGRVEIADRVVFLDGMLPSRVACLPGAELVIGSGTGFNYGVDIEATRSIRIGQRCMFASMVCLRDSAGGRCAPIVVEDDAWIAHGATVEPGVRIGARSVVSAGSVVTADVPPDSLAMGNPARSVSLELVAR